MSEWTAADIPSQTGRTAVVTGTGGLGFEAALELARAGAEVVLAGRSPDKAYEAIEFVRYEHPEARISFEPLDLASLSSVAAFATRIEESHARLDLLLLNAGVVRTPERRLTEDGFELQFGTNYLGHFALTAHLFPLLLAAEAPRIVTTGSMAHTHVTLDFDDLQSEKRYDPTLAYARSKLASLMFAFELQRRSDIMGWGLTSLAAHPGIARTGATALDPDTGAFRKFLVATIGRLIIQPPQKAVQSLLFAATAPEAKPSGYYGPTKMGGIKGPVGPAPVTEEALDPGAATRLWTVSEQLTGTSFPPLP